MMNLLDYADALNINISVTYVANTFPGWLATIEGIDEVEGGHVEPYKGCAATPALALKALAKTMSKTNAVFHDNDPARRYYRTVPNLQYLPSDC